jgi:hypothetical protein
MYILYLYRWQCIAFIYGNLLTILASILVILLQLFLTLAWHVKQGNSFTQYKLHKLLYKMRIHEEQGNETSCFMNVLRDALLHKNDL